VNPALLLPAALIQTVEEPPKKAEPLFYRDFTFGSEAHFNPLTSFISWSYDTLQVPGSFNDYNLNNRWDRVRWNLGHPNSAIRTRGNWGDFVNRQVIPYKGGHGDWAPNYSLHLLGGGMVYRKNAEWFEAHDVPAPRLAAAFVTMTAEVFQEVIEKTSTKADDEIADVYLFRPLGMLLFNWEPFARYAADTLQLAEWNFQPMFDPNEERPSGTRGKLVNVGQNFLVRPNLFRSRHTRAFVYFGLTTLAGLSHRVSPTDSLSWGLGAAIEHAQEPTKSHATGGLFWDRQGSLLASLIVNGTDDLKVRLNVYPGVLFPGRPWSPGLYVGIGKHGDRSFGVSLRMLPIGYSSSSQRR
jgi:hypothetical protein